MEGRGNTTFVSVASFRNGRNASKSYRQSHSEGSLSQLFENTLSINNTVRQTKNPEAKHSKKKKHLCFHITSGLLAHYSRSSASHLSRCAALTLSSSLFATEAGDLYVTDLATGSVIVYDSDRRRHDFCYRPDQSTGYYHRLGDSRHLYVADAGDGTASAGTIFKYDLSVGGGRATLTSGLNNPDRIGV